MNRSTARFLLLGTLAAFGIAGGAQAQTQVDVPATVTVNVGKVATLTITNANIVFNSTAATVAAGTVAADNPVGITVRARVASGEDAQLTVEAATDLTNGANTIPIANVSFARVAGSAAGFVASGNLAAATPVSLGTFANSGQRAGSFNFSLVDSANYASGTYAASITYSLLIP